MKVESVRFTIDDSLWRWREGKELGEKKNLFYLLILFKQEFENF